MALASSVTPPKMEIAVFRAIHTAYTKSLERSNHLFETADDDPSDNMRMGLIKRIDAILEGRGWGWPDLARAMKLSEQRVNNWRTRGIPAAQIRHIETALGMKRYALDEEHSEEDEADAAVAEFSWVYRNVSAEGRSVLTDAVTFVKRSFIKKERRTSQFEVVKDRRNKA